MVAAIAASVMSPEALTDHELLAGGFALIPALLLAYRRRWPFVMLLLAIGLVVLVILHLSSPLLGAGLHGPYLIVFVVAPYVSIALGAGWFGEVRRYQAELRTTQMQLVQSEKLESVGRMAAGVAHEVKNPLMLLLTGIKLLGTRVPDTDEHAHLLLQDMEEAVARADKIIAGLLHYAGDSDLELAQADVNAILERSVGLVRHELETTNISLTMELTPGLPMLALDQIKMQQVFVDLVINAVHAIDRDGAIKVRTSLDTISSGALVGRRKTDRFSRGEPVVTVCIEDSGPGVAPEHLAKIFDPFFTTKPTGRGTGLGLSVSRQIVELHGGCIAVANRAEGGARVTITLKVEREGAPS